jgi:hypothetical protein
MLADLLKQEKHQFQILGLEKSLNKAEKELVKQYISE